MGFAHDLPPIYNTTNYTDCISNGLIYCRIVAGIIPNVENDLWKKIAHLTSNENLMDRSTIHRGLCLQDNGQQLEAEEAVKAELMPLNLTAETKFFFCYDDNAKWNVTDFTLLALLATLLFTVFLATLKVNNGKPKGYLMTVLSKFSILKNWEKMTKLEGNEDFERLKSIQGIRIFTMISILMLHTKLQIIWMYISNVDYLEYVMTKKITLYHIFDLFLVQIFFLISGLLLTIQVYRIYEKNGKFGLKDGFVILLNRYFRLQVTSAVMILLYSSNLWQSASGPKMLEWLKSSQNSCRSHWAATLFLYNNVYYYEDTCNTATWYLSADFQMYVILTLILYSKFKCNVSNWTSLATGIIFSTAIYALIIYTYNLDVIPKPNMRNAELVQFFRSESFISLYSSTYSIAPTYFLGAITGFVYYRTKHIRISQRNVVTLGWRLCFLGLPTFAILISAEEYKGLTAALIGSIVKTLYALGFAIGILGMAHNIGGPIKKFLENRYFLVLSNFSYSTYLVNLAPSMLKIARDTSLETITPLFLFQEVVTFVAVGIIIGVILTFLVEFPMAQIQKMVLPQVKTSHKKIT